MSKKLFCYLVCYILYWITLLYLILSLLIFYKCHVAYLIIHQDTSIYFNVTLHDNILHSSIICTYQYELLSQIQRITTNYHLIQFLTDNKKLSIKLYHSSSKNSLTLTYFYLFLSRIAYLSNNKQNGWTSIKTLYRC